jgi:4-amino-4-deoxy-L-arabinose transferase-like glycosyltransferase
MAVFGSATVFMVGVLGRYAARADLVGLVAAAIAAVYPNLWVNDAHVMSETFATLAVVVALYLTYRCIRQPSWIVAVGLGVACGAAALARPELVALAPLLAVPAFVIPRWRSSKGWLRLAAAAIGTIVVIGPWLAFNMSRFERPVFLSSTDGQTLLGANCDLAYEGDGIGLWHLQCLRGTDGDQSESNAYQREAAIRYASDQGYRAPTVIAARFGRVWGVYAPTDMITYSEGEGRERWATALGVWTYFPVVALAVVGAVSMRRRIDDLWPLLMPIALVTVVAVGTYGHMRFRAVAEPSLVVLAAVGGVWVYRRLTTRAGSEPVPAPVD